LGIDANGGWSVRAAIGTIRRMVEGSDIYFAEQPVAPLEPAVAGRRTSKRQRAGDG